jgi:predicted site-specific integrase-resolvase
MPITVINEIYFRTAEACKTAGISKNTFLRWVKKGLYPDVKYRDRRGWRLFTQEEMAALKAEANRISRKN